MTKYDHNQICTSGSVVEVGKQYQYYEDGMIVEVTVVEDRSDDKGIGFLLKIDKRLNWPEKGPGQFSCWAALGKFAYSGMWRLYDMGTYGKF